MKCGYPIVQSYPIAKRFKNYDMARPFDSDGSVIALTLPGKSSRQE
jgi:hypothetical protein